MRILIVGLPNSGKSTLFNRLCRAHRRTGNFAGITVSGGDGRLVGHRHVLLTDLPGCYSLSDAGEGRLTAETVRGGGWDGAVVVCDAAAPERAARLLSEMRAFGRPLCLCCNFADELHRRGGQADTEALSDIFGLPVLAVSARTGEGMAALVQLLCTFPTRPAVTAAPTSAAGGFSAAAKGVGKAASERASERVSGKTCGTAFAVSRRADRNRNDVTAAYRGAAEPDDDSVVNSERASERVSGKACGTDSAISRRADCNRNDGTAAYRGTTEPDDDSVVNSERAAGKARNDALAATADRAAAAVSLPPDRRAARRDKLDRLLCGRWGWGFFLAAVGLLFVSLRAVSSGVVAARTEALCGKITEGAEHLLAVVGLPAPLCAFWGRGVLGGVTAVLGFLLPLFVLFFGLALLEDSGYGARVVFLFDAPMRRWGLSGECAFPLLLGFGCTVTGALSCRTVPRGRVRDRTLCALPCLSCSAKLPVYLFVTTAAGAVGGGWLLWLYPVGVLTAALQLALTKRLFPARSKNRKSIGNPSPFLLEMPPLRLPSLSVACKVSLRRTTEFIGRVLLPVTLCTTALWTLSHLSPSFAPCSSPENSLLRSLCGLPSVLLAPTGCGDWRLTASLFCGLFAKETAAATLSVLLAGEGLSLSRAVPFCLLVLLWPPCLHAQLALLHETEDKRFFAFGLLFQLAAGYLAAAAARLILSALGL